MDWQIYEYVRKSDACSRAGAHAARRAGTHSDLSPPRLNDDECAALAAVPACQICLPPLSAIPLTTTMPIHPDEHAAHIAVLLAHDEPVQILYTTSNSIGVEQARTRWRVAICGQPGFSGETELATARTGQIGRAHV